MKYGIIAVTITSITLAACGAAPQTLPTLPSPQVAPPSDPVQDPMPEPTATPTQAPSCKAINSVWGTHSTPTDAFLGIYLGPATNGPVYKIDWSHMHLGPQTSVKMQYDSSHSCYYDLTLWEDSITVNTFIGCDPWILPGHPVNTQCDYCPNAFSPGKVYPIQHSCNTLSIKDPLSKVTYTYQ